MGRVKIIRGRLATGPIPCPHEVTCSMSFSDFGLYPDLLRGIASLGFQAPTPIQRDAIPPGLAGDASAVILDDSPFFVPYAPFPITNNASLFPILSSLLCL